MGLGPSEGGATLSADGSPVLNTFPHGGFPAPAPLRHGGGNISFAARSFLIERVWTLQCQKVGQAPRSFPPAQGARVAPPGGQSVTSDHGMKGSLTRTKEGTKPERWRRSHDAALEARAFEGPQIPASHPAAEVERILREYACECYAVGRGESMYYLVEDLPRLAREATGEIMALQGGRKKPPSLPIPTRFEAIGRRTRVLLPDRRVAAAKGTAKSLVAALPFIAILAVIGLTIGLTFREFVTGG